MKRGRPENFYVFYDTKDFVACFGTPQQLVDDGLFKDTGAVRQKACKISKGKVKGNVVVIPG